MPSTLAQFNDKQVRTVNTSKSKECAAKSNKAADTLCKSEQGGRAAENVKKLQTKGKENDTFSTTSDAINYKPEDVELVDGTNNKLTVKGRREVKTDDVVYNGEFHEIFDLPNNVDNEDISLTQNKSECLLIEAPFSVNDLNQSKTEDEEQHKWNDELFDELFGEIYW